MRWVFITCIVLGFGSCVSRSPVAVVTGVSNAAKKSVTKHLRRALLKANLNAQAPVYIRIFKRSEIFLRKVDGDVRRTRKIALGTFEDHSFGVLEVWVKGPNKKFVRFKTYQTFTFSGALGPKVARGDYQAPEGAYRIKKGGLNPQSRFHLSLDLSYPNARDRRYGYTGRYIMIHGGKKSRGCFAMTNAQIEEIYTLVEMAFAGGQQAIEVHVFPFPMTKRWMSLVTEPTRFAKFSALMQRHWQSEQQYYRRKLPLPNNVKTYLKRGLPALIRYWQRPDNVKAHWTHLQTGFDHFERFHHPKSATELMLR